MKYPLTTAAAAVESFEAVNEGIWVTEEALQNIETAFSGHAAAVDGLNNQLAEQTSAAQAAAEELAAANATIGERDQAIAARDQQITTLQQRVTQLEGEAPPMGQTRSDKDETGAGSKIDTNELAQNKIADSLGFGPKAKKEDK